MRARAKLVLVGGGGHARVVADVASLLTEFEVVGYTDAGGKDGIPGLEHLGDDSVLATLAERGVTYAFVALGDNALRARLQRALAAHYTFPALVHPSAVIARSVTLGDGVIVMPGVVVNTGTAIGPGAIVNTGATIDHDCSIGAFAHVAPGCHLAGTVSLEEGVFLGVGTAVIPGIRVGAWTTVGAGAAVVRDLPGASVAVGVPARIRERRDP